MKEKIKQFIKGFIITFLGIPSFALFVLLTGFLFHTDRPFLGALTFIIGFSTLIGVLNTYEDEDEKVS